MTAKTDRLVTLFGGGGFIGRYVAQALFSAGARVRIAEREPKSAYYLRPLTGLGMIQFVRADVTDRAEVAAAVEGAEMVINLVGTFTGNLHAVHVDGAANVAEAAAAAGAFSLAHVSAIGADPDAPSWYGRTKGEGERAVQGAFPGATILRPSIVFGPEDQFVNRFARLARWLPVVPVIRGGWKLQPIYCADLGKAIAGAAFAPQLHGGRICELGGPQVVSMREIGEWICEATGRGSKPVLELPDVLAGPFARLFGWMPGAPVSWDQWLMMEKDNVASGDHPGLEAFGIAPTPLAGVAEAWLPMYRRRGRWSPAGSGRPGAVKGASPY